MITGLQATREAILYAIVIYLRKPFKRGANLPKKGMVIQGF